MERTKRSGENDGLIKWRNRGGSFRMASGRIIKPNQTFTAAPESIPTAFRDVIVPLEELPPEPVLEVVESGYKIQARSPGWYDIVDSRGKTVNEKGLRAAEAKEYLAQLGG